jgi:hypothetical protein
MKRFLLNPELEDFHASGDLRIPSRFSSKEEAFDAIGSLFDAQISFLQRQQRQTINALAEETERSGPQVQELLEAICDWPAFASGLRFRESNCGRLALDESAFVVKTAPALAYGPNVFGACSPAYQKEIKGVLELHGLPTGSRRDNDKATDSTVYLVEANPKADFALAAAVLPEGTQWDHTDPERYPVEIQSEIRAALIATAGGTYEVSTNEILRKDIFGPFLTSRTRHGCESENRLPVESGWIGYGLKGASYRFLGGELKLISYLQKNGFVPFLDLPRNFLPGFPKAPPLDCTFKLPDGREIRGTLLTWAAKVAFGILRPSRRVNDVFQLVEEATVEMAGADPGSVEYAVASAKVGKHESLKRLGIGLLVRNDGGVLSGWGIPKFEPDNDWQLRSAIEQAESHVARMRPDGGFQRTVERLQNAGLQTMGVKVPQHRKRREGLILGADVLLQRMLLHI